MKTFRIIILVILSIIDLFTIYSTIGYLVLGIKSPLIVGNTTTTFTGMYMMSLTFFAFTIVVTTLIILISKKLKK